MVPEVIAVFVFHGTQHQCRCVVHEPYTVASVIGIDGEEQADHIIIGEADGGYTDLGSAGTVQNTGGHFAAGALNEGIVLGLRKTLCEALYQITFQIELTVGNGIVMDAQDRCQLVIADGVLREAVDTVQDGNCATLRYPRDVVIPVHGKHTVIVVVGTHAGSDLTEYAGVASFLTVFLLRLRRHQEKAGSGSALDETLKGFFITLLQSLPIVFCVIAVLHSELS